MALTRARLEAVMIARIGPMFVEVSLPNTTAGTNTALDDPLATACRDCAIALADPTTVADADLRAVSAGQVSKLLDVAELRCLETCLGNWPWFTTTQSNYKYEYQQLGDRLKVMVDAKRAYIRQRYGIGLGAAVGGVVVYDTGTTGWPSDLGDAPIWDEGV